MSNFQRIKDALAGADLDAMLLTSVVGRFFATRFRSSAGVCVITRDRGYFFTDFRYIEAAKMRAGGFAVEMCSRDRPYHALVKEVLSSHGVKRLGFEEETMTVSEHEAFRGRLGAELVPAQGLLTRLRAVKQPDELALMKHAQEITDLTFTQMLPLIRPDVTERELAAEIVYRLLKNGAEQVSFDPVVVSGENSSMPHGVPGGRKIKAGDFVTLDFGCVYGGYCSDMTRTVAVGHASDEMKRVYEIVLRAQEEGIRAARGGVSGSAIDSAARSVIEKEGYGEHFGHSFGHGLGLEIHEKPGATPSDTAVLPAGTVISAEPGIYLPGRFGVRIEDVIVLTEDGCEDITRSAKELMVV